MIEGVAEELPRPAALVTLTARRHERHLDKGMRDACLVESLLKRAGVADGEVAVASGVVEECAGRVLGDESER